MTSRSLIIDNFRGIAVLAVVVGHYFGFGGLGFSTSLTVHRALFLSPYGVDLFFIISGHLLGGQLLDIRQPSATVIKHFYARRLVRTLPLYLIVVAMSLASLRPGELIALLTFTQNIYWTTHGSDAHFAGVTWSLAVEEQFYLFLPALIFAIPRSKLPFVLLGLAVASALFRLSLDPQGVALYTSLPARGDALILGVALAWRERSAAPLPPCQFLPRSRFLAWVGQRSYSTYLLHLPCAYLCAAALGLSTITGFVAIVLTLIVSHAAYTMIERPIHEWGRAKWPLRSQQEVFA